MATRADSSSTLERSLNQPLTLSGPTTPRHGGRKGREKGARGPAPRLPGQLHAPLDAPQAGEMVQNGIKRGQFLFDARLFGQAAGESVDNFVEQCAAVGALLGLSGADQEQGGLFCAQGEKEGQRGKHQDGPRLWRYSAKAGRTARCSS